MAVEIDIEGASPGVVCPPLDIFTDSFTVPDGGGGGLTYPWITLLTTDSFENPSPAIQPQIAKGMLDGIQVNAATLLLTTAANPNILIQARTFVTPIPFWLGKVPRMDTHAQFAEYTVTFDKTAAFPNLIHTGPAVFIQQWSPSFTGMGGGYIFQFSAELGQVLLARGMGTGGIDAGTLPGAILIPGGGPMVAAVGDRLRVEVFPQAGFNTVNCFVNGIQVGTVNDADVTRPQFGFPGFAFIFQGQNNVAFQRIDNFAAGPLP